MLRQHQRAITKAQRELDRERERLERQEKKLIADIKKSAKANQMVTDYGVVLTSAVSYLLHPVALLERLQSHGKRPCPHATLYSEILPDEDTTPSSGFAYPGKE